MVRGKYLVLNVTNTICFAVIAHKVVNIIFAIAKKPHLLHKPMRYYHLRLSEPCELTWEERVQPVTTLDIAMAYILVMTRESKQR
jgi:hypothetical protein